MFAARNGRGRNPLLHVFTIARQIPCCQGVLSNSHQALEKRSNVQTLERWSFLTLPRWNDPKNNSAICCTITIPIGNVGWMQQRLMCPLDALRLAPAKDVKGLLIGGLYRVMNRSIEIKSFGGSWSRPAQQLMQLGPGGLIVFEGLAYAPTSSSPGPGAIPIQALRSAPRSSSRRTSISPVSTPGNGAGAQGWSTQSSKQSRLSA